MKVVPRKFCKYTLLKGLTVAPKGRKRPERVREGSLQGLPPESGTQVQDTQNLPEGTVATGKATLGIATSGEDES